MSPAGAAAVSFLVTRNLLAITMELNCAGAEPRRARRAVDKKGAHVFAE